MENKIPTPQQTVLDLRKFTKQARLTQVFYQESVKAAFEANGNVLHAPQAELIHMLVKDFSRLLLTSHSSQDSASSITETLDSLKSTIQTYVDFVTTDENQMVMELV